MLQHRGQDSAGMVTTDWERFVERKDNGLVSNVFESKSAMDGLKGSAGIGHVRYPTAGTSSAAEAQPFFVNSPLGMYLIHNGNLTNVAELRERLQGQDSFFNRHLRTESDSEVLLNVWADAVHRAQKECLERLECRTSLSDPFSAKATVRELVLDAGVDLMQQLQGAYACIALVKDVGMVAFRDPNGIRPLVLGERQGPNGEAEYAFASEDCAFGPIGFRRVRDVRPGEMIIVTPEGELVSRQCHEGQCHPCIFEYIYLSRPDSVLNDISVYDFQIQLGRKLAERIREKDWEYDMVVPVPDGSRPAAIEMSAALGVPYREGLVKNRYVGRTFIMPDQVQRELSVRRKLNAMSTVFEGKRVVLVDDSIVRGTTMSQIVSMVRNAGAAKVYLASAAPAVRYPNVHGVDMPSRKEFVADGRTTEEVCEALGADGLLYQTVDDLIATGKALNPSIEKFDDSCFTGEYVSGVENEYIEGLAVGAGRGSQRRSGRTVQLLDLQQSGKK